MTVIGRVRASRPGLGLTGTARSLLTGAIVFTLGGPTLAVADSQQTFAEKRLGERGNHPLRLAPNLVASEWISSGQTSDVKVVNGRVEIRGWVAGAALDQRQFAQIRLTPDAGWALKRFQLSWECVGLQAERNRPRIAFADVWAFVGTNDTPAATFGVYQTMRNQPVSQNWSAPVDAAPGEPVTLRFFGWGDEPLDGSSHLVLDDLRLGGVVVNPDAYSLRGLFVPFLGGRGNPAGVLGFVSVGVIVGAVVLSLLIAVWMLALVLQRFSGMASQQSEIIHALGMAERRSAADRGNLAAAVAEVVEPTSARLSNALARIEHRIGELVQSARSALTEFARQRTATRADERAPSEHPRVSRPASAGSAPTAPASAATSNGAHFEMLLGKGQALLGLGKPEPALVCFEEALRLQPQNTEVILKAGQALEILQRLDEAMRCYDRAVRLDDSLAIAWLHKGRICNRLERHEEALECYEHAGRVEPHDPEETTSAHGA
jgi:hypothetical protein